MSRFFSVSRCLCGCISPCLAGPDGKDGRFFVTSVTPTLLALPSNGSSTVTVNLFVPESAPAGTDDAITLVATSVTDPNASNSSVQTFEVSRGDVTPPDISIAPNPSSLWPPDNKPVSVVVSGTVIDSQSGVNPGSGTFTVSDEYGVVQPAGSFLIAADGSYSFTVSLIASRLGTDLDGRMYTISVQATDNAGNVGSASTTVVVPHDQR